MLATQLKTQPLWRFRQTAEPLDDKLIVVEGRTLLNFAGNNYLALANHPIVKKAFMDAVEKYGLGSTSSPLVSGYSNPHLALEEEFAAFLGRERALLFNSGYHANLAVMSTFANRNSCIIADKYCHASLIDGMQLSRAKLLRYKHNDLQHAEELLAMHSNSLLVTESVFSMSGEILDIDNIIRVSKKTATTLIIDDAHGIGVLGNYGKGISDGIHQPDLPCLITPLGKSLASMGAIVTGSSNMIEALIQNARTYRYSTALPPAVCVGTLAALKILQSETERGERLHSLIEFFNRKANHLGLKMTSNALTPIRCMMVGDNLKTLELQNHLQQNGFYVACIRPPTVPTNTARLRISLNCEHDENNIENLLTILADYLL